MRALEWHGRRDIELVDIPEPPEPEADSLVVEVSWAGICGTDLHEYLAGPIFIRPEIKRVVLGHEFAATVVQVGNEVRTVKVGDRVVAYPHRVCRSCHFCERRMFQHCQDIEFTGLTLNGAFARFTTLREDQVVHLPDGIPDEFGALVEPLAVAFRAVGLPGVNPGEDVLVIGAGPIGLCTVLLAKAVGLGDVYVVEKLENRAGIAERLGATAIINPTNSDPGEAIRDITSGAGFPVTIECVGLVETMNLAIRAASSAGLAILVGITEEVGGMDLNPAVVQGKEIRGCIGYFGGEFDGVIELLRTGRLNPGPMITRKIALEEIVEAGFLELVDNRDASAKTLVSPL